ncbi:MAG: ISL3 family transposase [Acidimicrobiales bacterium]
MVLDVEEGIGELIVRVESTKSKAACPSCRRQAQAQDRVEVHLRDLHCFGRPCRLVIRKRRWRCRTSRCIKKTWTETLTGIAPRHVLTRRAGAEVTRQVGQLCRSVASVALEYGVGWDTAWAAVTWHGTPLVEDRFRVGIVRALGVDEHSYLSATPSHATIYATSLVDLDRRRIIDLFEGKSAAKLRRWSGQRSKAWLGSVKVVALDLTDTYRSGLSPHLTHAKKVADPFHVIRVANRMVDQVRRRVQQEALGHRGRKADPLFRIRKLLVKGEERLDERGREKLLAGLRVGDPHDELLGAWLAKESVRAVYLVDDVAEATERLDNVIVACREDLVPEIRTMGHTLSRWREEILNHHRTGASNGPTEGTNFCAKQVKRAGRGLTNFGHYRLRVLLYAGGVSWPTQIRPPRITSTRPH